jgi:hypothetical protein
VVRQVVAPILTVANSCLIAISTLGEKVTNIFTKMIKSESFAVQEVKLICDPCQALGLKDKACKHNMDFMPEWVGANSEIISTMVEDDTLTFARESLGVVNDDDGMHCFTKSSIERLMSAPRVGMYVPQRYLYIVVDPSGGSDIRTDGGSDFVVVAISGPGTIIAGIDAYDAVRTEDYATRLVTFIKRLRALPMYLNAVLVLDAESGSGYVAGDVESIVRCNFSDVVCMSDFTERKPGTLTTNAKKLKMMELTRVALDTGEIYFSRDFVTTNPDEKKLLKDLEKQMYGYSRVISPSTSVRSRGVMILSGKDGGKSKDDLSTTLQRALLVPFSWHYDVKYQKHHR